MFIVNCFLFLKESKVTQWLIKTNNFLTVLEELRLLNPPTVYKLSLFFTFQRNNILLILCIMSS